MCFSSSCTDVNPAAAQCTAKTSSCNNVSLQPVLTSLVRLSHSRQVFTCFKCRYLKSFPSFFRWRVFCLAWAGRSTSFSSTLPMWSPLQKRWCSSVQQHLQLTDEEHFIMMCFLFQVGSRGIEAAWAGGKQGREVTDRFLPLVAQLLSSKGLFYLITIAENDPEEIIRLLGDCGLKGESCLSTRAGNERLSVLRFQRS